MLQAFIWSVQSRCKPKRPDTQRPSFPAVLLQIFICFEEPIRTLAFCLKPTPFPRNKKALFDEESVIKFEYILFTISDLFPLFVK